MERYVWVRHARRWFADVLNTAAYGAERVVILRRGEELGAFVGTADLDYLRRTRPLSRYPEPQPPPMPPDPAEEWEKLKRQNEKAAEAYFADQRRKAEEAQAAAMPPEPPS